MVPSERDDPVGTYLSFGIRLLFTLASLIVLGGPLEAQTLSAQPLPARATYAAVGAATRTPYGWADLCGRQPQECRVDVLDPADLLLSAQTWAILESVNTRVNADIEPVSNLEHWGTLLDHWEFFFYVRGYC